MKLVTNMLSTDSQVTLPTHKEVNFIKFHNDFKGLWIFFIVKSFTLNQNFFFTQSQKAKFLILFTLVSLHEVAKP